MTKPFISCSDCEGQMRFVRDRYTAEIKNDGRHYTVDLAALDFYRCESCGSVVVPDDSNALIGRELRKIVGLMMPDEIKGRRTALGLTQKDLADRLGVADATVCRWETGAQIQQLGYDRQMRTFFDLPAVRDYYEQMLLASHAGTGGIGSAAVQVFSGFIWSDAEVVVEQVEAEQTEETEWCDDEIQEWTPGVGTNRVARYLALANS